MAPVYELMSRKLECKVWAVIQPIRHRHFSSRVRLLHRVNKVYYVRPVTLTHINDVKVANRQEVVVRDTVAKDATRALIESAMFQDLQLREQYDIDGDWNNFLDGLMVMINNVNHGDNALITVEFVGHMNYRAFEEPPSPPPPPPTPPQA